VSKLTALVPATGQETGSECLCSGGGGTHGVGGGGGGSRTRSTCGD
jgi:hypothetical protein